MHPLLCPPLVRCPLHLISVTMALHRLIALLYQDLLEHHPLPFVSLSRLMEATQILAFQSLVCSFNTHKAHLYHYKFCYILRDPNTPLQPPLPCAPLLSLPCQKARSFSPHCQAILGALQTRDQLVGGQALIYIQPYLLRSKLIWKCLQSDAGSGELARHSMLNELQFSLWLMCFFFLQAGISTRMKRPDDRWHKC